MIGADVILYLATSMLLSFVASCRCFRSASRHSLSGLTCTLYSSLRVISHKVAKVKYKRRKKIPLHACRQAGLRYLSVFARNQAYAKMYHLHHGSFRFGKNNYRKKISRENWIAFF